jgi:hypothetical protein
MFSTVFVLASLALTPASDLPCPRAGIQRRLEEIENALKPGFNPDSVVWEYRGNRVGLRMETRMTLKPGQSAVKEPSLDDYPPEQWALSLLNWQLLRVEEKAWVEFLKRDAWIQAIFDEETSRLPLQKEARRQALLRNDNCLLLSRLAVRRAQVLDTDLTCHKVASICRRWAVENQRLGTRLSPRTRPGGTPNDYFSKRAEDRTELYREVLDHRWSWENRAKPAINGSCLDGLSKLFGYGKRSDVFLLHVGWVEAYLTEIWPFLR